jgi:hypothetical protein
MKEKVILDLIKRIERELLPSSLHIESSVFNLIGEIKKILGDE